MLKTAIFTSYFSKKKHPQLGDPHIEGVAQDGRVLQNDISYIKGWYDSVLELNLHGRVFHDNLSDEFIDRFTTDKIKFVKVGDSPFSNNDWRFFCYRKFLDEDAESSSFDNVFLTDSSDVVVVNDPSMLVETHKDYDYFVCNDSINLASFPYLQVHKAAGWKDLLWFTMMASQLELINMGVLGGKREKMVRFLDRFCLTRLLMGKYDFNADMWVGQYVFRALLDDSRILIGDPITSKFKSYEVNRTDVYFRHK